MKLFRVLTAVALVWTCLPAGTEEVVSFGRFGPVTLYHGARPPAHVVLFVSGDGGWNLGVVDMAKSLAGLDALVAGIDITRYISELAKTPENCLYPAADFEALSKFVQEKAGVPEYIPPVLVGYSSGATLVYATLVEAPASEFKGAISYDLPAGVNVHTGSFTLAYSGKLLGVGGHLHDYGKGLTLADDSSKEVIADLPPKTDAQGRLLSMPIKLFLDRGGYPLMLGQVLTVSAQYENPTGQTIPEGAMGIAVGYFLPDDAAQMAKLKR